MQLGMSSRYCRNTQAICFHFIGHLQRHVLGRAGTAALTMRGCTSACHASAAAPGTRRHPCSFLLPRPAAGSADPAATHRADPPAEVCAIICAVRDAAAGPRSHDQIQKLLCGRPGVKPGLGFTAAHGLSCKQNNPCDQKQDVYIEVCTLPACMPAPTAAPRASHSRHRRGPRSCATGAASRSAAGAASSCRRPPPPPAGRAGADSDRVLPIQYNRQSRMHSAAGCTATNASSSYSGVQLMCADRRYMASGRQFWRGATLQHAVHSAHMVTCRSLHCGSSMRLNRSQAHRDHDMASGMCRYPLCVAPTCSASFAVQLSSRQTSPSLANLCRPKRMRFCISTKVRP
jgi:hypothetical protein